MAEIENDVIAKNIVGWISDEKKFAKLLRNIPVAQTFTVFEQVP
jgi:hypothetical protein